MLYFVLLGVSLGVQFHVYRAWGWHAYQFDGARRYAVTIGGLTVDLVTAA